MTIGTKFTAKDGVSGPVRRMGGNVSKFSTASKRQIDSVSRSMDRLGRIAKKGALILSGALMLATGAIAREFVQYDAAITSASAKFGGLNLATAEGQAKLESLKKTAREVGATTKFSATEAAQGLDFLAMAGFNADQAIATLPGVTSLATVAQTDLARATDIASDSIGAFGLMSQDTAVLQQNFTRINDVFAKTMTRTNTNMEDLFEAVKKGAPAFTSAGQSLETFNALVGVMANSGVKGAESGTQLRNVMLRLAKPTAEAQDTLNSLGVTTQDAQGNFRDVVDILADVEKGLVGMGTQQRSAALATIFGARSVTGINILLQEGTDSIRGFRNELENAGGTAKQMAGVIEQSLQNRLLGLQSAAIEVGFQFVDKIEGQAGDAIVSLTEAVRQIPVEQIVNGITTAVNVFLALWNSGLIPAVLAGVAVFKVLTAASVAYTLIMTKVAAIQLIAAKTGGIFNAVMAANPVGLIILGIAALIAIIVLVVKNWDRLKNVFMRGVRAVAGFFTTLKDKIVAIAQIIGEAIKKGFTAAFDFVKKVVFTFADYFLTIWGTIISVVLGGAKKVAGALGLDTSGIDRVLSGLNDVRASVREQSFFGDTPTSPNAGVVESRSVEQRNSTVDLNINNIPQGSTINQKGSAPGFRLNPGYAGG